MNASSQRPASKVEVTGFEARHYDTLMNLFTAGTYPFFIRRVVRQMAIHPGDRLLLLGSGTGRNACLMNRFLDGRGRIVGLDIGPEMLAQARRRCARYPWIEFVRRRIEEPLPYRGEFDKVFLAFVLHGFPQEQRRAILANARQALRPGGQLQILDYSEFEPARSPWPVRLVFRLECPLATDFVRRDWRAILQETGFRDFRVHPHYRGYVRLLVATRAEDRAGGSEA